VTAYSLNTIYIICFEQLNYISNWKFSYVAYGIIVSALEMRAYTTHTSKFALASPLWKVETLTQCAEWSQFVIYSSFSNLT